MIRKLLQGLRALRRGDSDPDWEFDERRVLLRMRCHYDVDCRLGEKRFPGQIVDMSLGGMKLRCFQNMTVGQNVDVTCRLNDPQVREETIRCKVQWVRSREKDLVHFVGLSYDASDEVLRHSWVKMVLKQMGFNTDRVFQRRKYVRAECFISAAVVHRRLDALDGKLYNLGARGALIETRRELPVGESVEIRMGPLDKLPILELSGQIVQVTESNRCYLLGIEFEDLSDRAVDRLGRYLHALLTEHWTE